MKNRTSFFILLFLSVIFLPFIFWNITFGFYAGYISLIIYFAGLFFYKKAPGIRPLITFLISGVAVYLFMIPLTLHQLENTSAGYQAKINRGEHLTFIEKCNIYGLNITMVVVGYPIFPELSKEAFLMMFPSKSGVREFEDDFFMKSKKMQEAFKKSPRGKVYWPHYDFPYHEARTGLTLNLCTYEITKSNGIKTYKASTKVRYPANAQVIIKTFPIKIVIEEGILHYLEKEGWLFPYTSIWIHKESV